MRVTIKLDSATADELWDMVCAFQRTTGIALPPGLQGECRLAGIRLTPEGS